MSNNTDALDEEMRSPNNNKELDQDLDSNLKLRSMLQISPVNNIKHME